VWSDGRERPVRGGGLMKPHQAAVKGSSGKGLVVEGCTAGGFHQKMEMKGRQPG